MDNIVIHIKEMFLDGKISVPGYIPMPATAPSLEEVADVCPDLRLCSWTGSGKNSGIKVPEAIETRWKTHEQFGEAFQATTATDMATGGSDPCESPLKRPKTEPTTPTAVKEEPTATASEELKAHLDSSVRVAVPGLGGMALAFYNEDVYLYNNTAESTLTMKAGAVVAQFQRGKWVSGFQNLPEASKSTCIPFCLTGSQDLVMVGPQVSTLGNVVETARMKDPLTAKVAYHELVEKSVPGEVYAFTATLKHQHAWKSEPSDVMPAAGPLATKSCAW